jgi:Trypsin-like peptidase domain
MDMENCMSCNLPVMIVGAYFLGVILLFLLEKMNGTPRSNTGLTRKQYLFNRPIAFEEQRYTFLLFFISFGLAWNLIYFKILPAKVTYDAVFGPVMVTGCWWFIHLFINTHRNLGWDKSQKLLVTMVILWTLANIVDLGLIKLGAWNFSKNTTLGIIPFPFFLEKDVFGNTIEVPYVEVLGFNLFIGWFILFVQMFINDLIKSPSSWKKLFTSPSSVKPLIQENAPHIPDLDFQKSIRRAVDSNDMLALEEALANLFQSLTMGLKLDEKEVRRTLDTLRKKRLFFQMQRVCEVCFKYDFAFPVVLRQMAQALIDQGSPHSAPFYLSQIDLSLLQETAEWKESKGLMGRTYKQCYVDLGEKNLRAEQYLLSALEQYRSVYLKDKSEFWHGINYVACTARGHRDKLADKAFSLDWKKPAAEIFESLTKNVEGSNMNAWTLATCLEACVAMDKLEDAKLWLQRYVNCTDSSADVFEFTSTYRQLVEVWQLDQNPTYIEVLNSLRKAILERPTGKVAFRRHDFQRDSGMILIDSLEKAAQGLVRVERKDGTPVGSGFLVAGISISDKWKNHPVVFITAEHVLGGQSSVLELEDAFLNFFSGEGRGRPLERLWSSSDLDVAIFSLSDPQLPCTLPICNVLKHLLELIPNKSRIFILGHPLGGSLQINCSNNHFVGCSSTYIRYKTQTWPGSSGSPILDENWRVIGVHTEASIGEDTNQGVNFPAIVEAVRLNF